MKLFHITPQRYIYSIINTGIRPCTGNVGFCKLEGLERYKKMYNTQPIFLTNDIEMLCNEMLTKKWVLDNNPVAIQVDLNADDENLKHGLSSRWEFVYFAVIPPTKITIIDFDFGGMLLSG